MLKIMTTLHLAINDTLKLKRLRPSTKVNATLSDLVQQVVQSESIDMDGISTKAITRVRRKSGRAESYMEAYWSHRITRSSDPIAALQSFPYLTNYQQLTVRELKFVQRSGLAHDKISRVLVIGSGPLPLTAYELGQNLDAVIDQVDSSKKATKLGRRVGAALTFDSQYYVGKGEAVVLENSYDLILIAALAGETTEAKQAIIDNVLPHLNQGGRIIIRSAHGARAVLYPIVGELQRVTLLETHHPKDDIINSILIYEAA